MSNGENETSRCLSAAIAAGCTEDEIKIDPVHGILINASGIRKLAKLAPNQARAARLLVIVNGLSRESESTVH